MVKKLSIANQTLDVLKGNDGEAYAKTHHTSKYLRFPQSIFSTPSKKAKGETFSLSNGIFETLADMKNQKSKRLLSIIIDANANRFQIIGRYISVTKNGKKNNK